ncbi:MAG: hypothetical protein PVG14_20020, partial [Anaerolineales bacterium]
QLNKVAQQIVAEGGTPATILSISLSKKCWETCGFISIVHPHWRLTRKKYFYHLYIMIIIYITSCKQAMWIV